MNYSIEYNNLKSIFLQYMDCYFNKKQLDNFGLYEAVKYSLYAGGKRVRPVLMLATVKMLNGNIENALPFSLAIECVHTYSLVHDDLPEMDNDEYRRGNLSTHTKFGHNNGLLAGDALLNLAYEICFENFVDLSTVKAGQIIAEYSGIQGMLEGQTLDKRLETQTDVSLNDILKIYKYKTCKLLIAPLAVGSVLCGEKYFDKLCRLGELFGYIFQITDDKLDFGKKTDINIYNVLNSEQVEKLLNDYVTECEQIMNSMDDADFFKSFLTSMINRVE